VHPNFETYSCFKRVARAGGPSKPLPQVVTPDVPVSDTITATDIYQFLRYEFIVYRM